MTDMFRIPKLAKTADGKVTVTHWGQAASLLLRVGDRLVINVDRQDGLLVLEPTGWGNPMIGRRSNGQLVAEPSGAPASPLRWSATGSIEAVDRDLERGGIGPGRWFVAVRIEASDLAALTKARKTYTSGWMSAADVDALCRRAAVAPEVSGVAIAVAAARDQAAAERLLEHTKAARLRFEIRPVLEPRSGFGVVLEGPWRRIGDGVRPGEARGPAGRQVVRGRRRGVTHRARVAANGAMVQLSLFGDSASDDG